MSKPLFFYAIIILFTFCGYEGVGDEPVARPDLKRHQRIEHRIEELGGTVDHLGRAALAEYGLPANCRGAICGIYLRYCNLEGVDAEALFPEDVLILANLTGSTLTNEQAAVLGDCKKLQHLYASSSTLTDESLKRIAELPDLQQINLNRCNITDDGLKQLHKCKSLTGLWLVDTHVTSEGIATFKEAFPDTSVRWVTVPSEEVRQALAELERSGAYVAGMPDRFRAEHEGLYRFSVIPSGHWKPDSTNTIELLRTVNASGLLKLAFDTPLPKCFSQIGSLTNIHQLLLNGSQLTDEQVKTLAGVEQIGFLQFNGTQITTTGLRYLSRIKLLKNLYLEEAALDTAGVAALAACNGLRKLEIHGCDLQNSSLDALAACKSLQKLTLDRCENLRPQAIESLQKKRPMLIIEKD